MTTTTSVTIPPSRPVPIAMLRDIGLFGGLDDATLSIIADTVTPERAESGSTLIQEGDVKPEMFVVLSGELEVLKRARDGEVRMALLGPGDWFGEMTILDVRPRSATVRALAPTLYLRMTAEHVEQLFYRRNMRDYAILMTNIARELSRRLRVADGILTQTLTSMNDAYLRRR